MKWRTLALCVLAVVVAVPAAAVPAAAVPAVWMVAQEAAPALPAELGPSTGLHGPVLGPDNVKVADVDCFTSPRTFERGNRVFGRGNTTCTAPVYHLAARVALYRHSGGAWHLIAVSSTKERFNVSSIQTTVSKGCFSTTDRYYFAAYYYSVTFVRGTPAHQGQHHSKAAARSCTA